MKITPEQFVAFIKADELEKSVNNNDFITVDGDVIIAGEFESIKLPEEVEIEGSLIFNGIVKTNLYIYCQITKNLVINGSIEGILRCADNKIGGDFTNNATRINYLKIEDSKIEGDFKSSTNFFDKENQLISIFLEDATIKGDLIITGNLPAQLKIDYSRFNSCTIDVNSHSLDIEDSKIYKDFICKGQIKHLALRNLSVTGEVELKVKGAEYQRIDIQSPK